MRPRVAWPTGTVIGAPVSSTSAPRGIPSVESMATARTRSLPEMLLHLGDQVDRGAPVLLGDLIRVARCRCRQVAVEDGVDDDALDLDDLADVLRSQWPWGSRIDSRTARPVVGREPAERCAKHFFAESALDDAFRRVL